VLNIKKEKEKRSFLLKNVLPYERSQDPPQCRRGKEKRKLGKRIAASEQGRAKAPRRIYRSPGYRDAHHVDYRERDPDGNPGETLRRGL
jgi:hypothetical protein